MNSATSQTGTRIVMMNPCFRTTVALFLSFSAAIAYAAAENVPYDLSKETYKTETLFSYDGCFESRLMANSGQPKVFKKNVYVAIVVYGLHPRVLQVPLDGGEAKIGHLEPDYVIANDSHQFFTLSVDKAGYIHLTGGMHGGPWKYWISAKPEDVSKFIRAIPPAVSKELRSAEKETTQGDGVTKELDKAPDPIEKPGDDDEAVPIVAGQQQGPPGFGITYPNFHTDAAGNLFLESRGSTPSFQKGRQGKIVHIGLLSTYDADKREWRLLGADIPKEFGGHPGNPVTVWGDCFENGPAGDGWYVKNNANYVAAPDNTLHFLFHILNYASPKGKLSSIESSTHAASKDILYAVSKDGGRTLQRADGSKVEWPVCAKPGPYQPDVIYAGAADYAAMEKAGDGKFPGLTGGQIELDWKGRPMIKTHKPSMGTDVVFRLENGKWVTCPAQAFGSWRDNAGVLMNIGDSEDGNKGGKHSHEVTRLWDQDHSRVVNLGHDIGKLDEDYLRDTGTMIYTTKGKTNAVINIVRTTIQRPTGTSN